MVGDTGDDTAAGAVGFGGAKKTRGALVLALGEGEKSEGVKGQVRERLRGAAGAAEFTENIQRPGVQRHADLQLAGFAPLRGPQRPQRPQRLQRADERTVRRVEGHAEGITDRFEKNPPTA